MAADHWPATPNPPNEQSTPRADGTDTPGLGDNSRQAHLEIGNQMVPKWYLQIGKARRKKYITH